MAGRSKESAGILLYRLRGEALEVFLVHPGGPFFTGKDVGAWSLPKGEIEPGEDPLAVARREFAEETGRTLRECAGERQPISLGSVVQRGGKVVHAWAVEGDWPDGLAVTSNDLELEWPPRSGRRRRFPEVDEGRFVDLATARRAINPAQMSLLDRLVERLGRPR